MKSWQRLTDFLEEFNLIPLVIIVSVYHYHEALRTHDPFFVSLPIAVFLDVLHYRSVQQAVRGRRLGWALTAVFTTVLAYSLQWIFYTDGGTVLSWQPFVFASLVPVGVAIMALHHETGAVDLATRLQDVAHGLQSELAALQEQQAALQAGRSELQGQVERLKGALKVEQEQRKAAEGERARLQEQLAEMERQAAALQEQQAHLQALAVVWENMNDRARAAARYNAGLLATLDEAASEAGVSTSTISRLAGSLNGSN